MEQHGQRFVNVITDRFNDGDDDDAIRYDTIRDEFIITLPLSSMF